MGDVGADIKTHYVIQQQAPTESVASISDAPQEIAQMNAESLTDHAMSEVLPIRCKDTNAEMHRSRFGSGGRGRCIRFKDEWLTPSEFERRCGRGSSKDWKRSIKSGGVDIQTLINGNVLKPHANSCSCSICCDDPSKNLAWNSDFIRTMRPNIDWDTLYLHCRVHRPRAVFQGLQASAAESIGWLWHLTGPA